MTLGMEITAPLDRRMKGFQKMLKNRKTEVLASQQRLENQMKVMTNLLECHRDGTITRQQGLDQGRFQRFSQRGGRKRAKQSKIFCQLAAGGKLYN